ncbi:bifunctional [glutamate--ammonia ligase]-adenylyl-L-tyrosine phosphorylase/[glutamate--ammonia-ligase] adenylyltransferase [Candidatus Berkiella cookevillensis]|uniref:Bifunctional glutamine synthetase adenylyltransferase/adenylyl-removing enzyme n=1 Tax=Candidatus Berkiella cookevillensis TaxID=437022 RepID=A0A0Q9YQ67_9GAMM|nr:bifunctional [glutamate--ammonia ligase]-adenylyl-L-tyrosine phosphorylase/[glutamate--ammonia-ligase] adenylyltransferase [Candidatus Berkiella cookevillensis]MCS5707511.1 bifunctional [glutamate--ammonia ligase]-adenylyl-L-tyrosine phosphorylase/[glutamate--ammonia-ligase] adenylyltransferase [Candidatus Berkiella cookevillensis]
MNDLASTNQAPSVLQDAAKRHWEKYSQACLNANIPIELITSAFKEDIAKIFATSDFVSDVFCKYPQLPLTAYHKGLPEFSLANVKEILKASLSGIDELDAFKRILRQLRAQQTSLIIWRFLLHKVSLETHLRELSLLADMLVKKTCHFILKKIMIDIGRPETVDGQEISFVVIALGKLGGQELNFSSDIDLIFAYTDKGVVADSKSPINVEQYFTRVAQLVISILSDRTEDGFVYRVDMRLRPYGESGALVLTFDQLEQYYQYQGRDWERYALIKARLITGDNLARKRLKSIIQPFVYRRYLDYSAFESLREMKSKVELDVRKNNRQNDIKLGKGGIRQIEFIAQAFQLIRGGKNIALQKRNLLRVLKELKYYQIISETKYTALKSAYCFLRALEHFLQMLRDEQTHQLPADEIDKSKVALLMGLNHWEELSQLLIQHLKEVTFYFETLSAVPAIQSNIASEQFNFGKNIWMNPSISLSAVQCSDTFIEQIHQFKESALVRGLKAKARSRLDQVMPVVLDIIVQSEAPDMLLARTLKFLRAIARRSAYLAFLIEKEGALSYLLKVFDKSEWINSQLCQYPVLLDEILTPVSIAQIHSKLFWQQDLTQKMKGVKQDDLEQQMEKLRQFKLGGFLSIALHERLTKKEVDVSLALNHLVEVILEKTYFLCLQFILQNYNIKNSISEMLDEFPFALIAYGKLGAKELSYLSDLDLVFLYDDSSLLLEKEIQGVEVFVRLAQRMIHMLSTQTLSGKLFDVDVRLRPGGSAGMLVGSLSGFQQYLTNQAWVWEHQALVNARFILGAPELKEKFEAIRKNTLVFLRNQDTLRKSIGEMRQKMLDNQYKASWNIKTVPGGMIDIEFIVQYAVLYYAHQYPYLAEQYGTLNVLMVLRRTPLLSEKEVEILICAYAYYQYLQNDRLLQPDEKPNQEEISAYQQQVMALWHKIFLSSEF